MSCVFLHGVYIESGGTFVFFLLLHVSPFMTIVVGWRDPCFSHIRFHLRYKFQLSYNKQTSSLANTGLDSPGLKTKMESNMAKARILLTNYYCHKRQNLEKKEEDKCAAIFYVNSVKKHTTHHLISQKKRRQE